MAITSFFITDISIVADSSSIGVFTRCDLLLGLGCVLPRITLCRLIPSFFAIYGISSDPFSAELRINF